MMNNRQVIKQFCLWTETHSLKIYVIFLPSLALFMREDFFHLQRFYFLSTKGTFTSPSKPPSVLVQTPACQEFFMVRAVVIEKSD